MDNTILLVDDSATLRMGVSSLLGQAGYNVIAAGDGISALKTMNENKVNMVITDIIMAEMDGLKLIEEIKKHSEWKNIPVIVLSSESSTEEVEKGRKAGALGWIIKPFDNDKLVQVVRKILC